MDQALAQYTKANNDYFDALGEGAIKTPAQMKQLEKEILLPASVNVSKSAMENLDQTLKKNGVGYTPNIQAAREKFRAEPQKSVVSTEKITERIKASNDGAKDAGLAKRSPANESPAKRRGDEADTAPSAPEIVVSGEQKVDHIYFPGKSGKKQQPAAGPHYSAGQGTFMQGPPSPVDEKTIRPAKQNAL